MLDIDRFGLFVTSITQIYRHMQKIKQLEMTEFGLRGSHVMCVYNLSRHKNGLTPTELCTLCEEDKGAVSRTLSELKKLGYINYTPIIFGEKKYRQKITLTEEGKKPPAR